MATAGSGGRVEIPRTRSLTIIAQDPSVRSGGKIVLATVDVPAEALAAGPWGHRVQIIDYDASTHTLYQPLTPERHVPQDGRYVDPFAGKEDSKLLGDPNFHAQNVYAIAMRLLARFEFALGRRVSWGFDGHQLKIAPHAFADANAFYSPLDEALVFGYFPAPDDGSVIFSCLSHDIVAHETTHALLDGLRNRFTVPSSPDQAAFHEGFADVVALLSIFSLREVVEVLLDLHVEAAAEGSDRRDPAREERRQAVRHRKREQPPREGAAAAVVDKSALDEDTLRRSLLFGLAEEMGEELTLSRGEPLRRSAALAADPSLLGDPRYQEPHRRGEILVAAMMNALIAVWSRRLQGLGTVGNNQLDRERVAEEGAEAAEYLLTMTIRAVDYTPVVHLTFDDYLSALLTADAEIRPDDRQYEFRRHLRESFARYGIEPASKGTAAEPGIWRTVAEECELDARLKRRELDYARTHFEPMTRDPDEVFWFVWENREQLKVNDGAYGDILSVRPCLRIGPDGFPLKETVAEFIQILKLSAAELPSLEIEIPAGMPPDTRLVLYGGNTLLFDEYGRVKYNIHNGILDHAKQSDRLAYLWKSGYFSRQHDERARFTHMHLRRALDLRDAVRTGEEW